MNYSTARSKPAARYAFNLAIATALAASIPALAGTTTPGAGSDQNGIPEITISTSGSTALKKFITGGGFTLVEPNHTVSLSNRATPYGGVSGVYQLAPSQLNSGDGSTASDAVRFEYHESGAVEGPYELISDQIATLSFVQANVDRNPNNGNAVWVNQNQFGGVGAPGWPGTTLVKGNYLGPIYGTNPDGSVKAFGTGVNPQFDATGKNISSLAGSSFSDTGQNAIQIAFSDQVPVQSFQNITASTDTHSATPWTRTPSDLHYGTGNPALPVGFIGSGGNKSVYYQPTSVLNMLSTAVNPRSLTAATFGSGPWNNAGLGNLDSRTIATTATVFAANPGTGLDVLNQTDAQWLETTGRLANGATFQMTTRDPGSGTRNVSALNTGIDPTYAVGVNDSGNGNGTGGADTQISIGSGIRFSNKTAGGAQLRPTVQNARMAVGTLSVADAHSVALSNSVANPVRALSYANQAADPSNLSGFIAAGPTTITDGTYAIYQLEQVLTVKAPDSTHSADTVAQWTSYLSGDAATDPRTGTHVRIQGDGTTTSPTYNVSHIIDNAMQTVKDFPPQLATTAYNLLQNGYILPQMMKVTKPNDGAASVTNTTFSQSAYDTYFSSGASANTTQADPATIFAGSGSAYGAKGTNTATFKGSIAITDVNGGVDGISHHGGNWLFGNFDQTGVRDYHSVVVSAQIANAALEGGIVGGASYGGTNSIFTGTATSNSDNVKTGMTALDALHGGSGATKGDLIVLGDYNGDGVFDGKDLYAMAVGASLSNDGGTHVSVGATSTFGVAVRSATLYKNAALTYLNTNATTAQMQEAIGSAIATSAATVPYGAHDQGVSANGGETFTFDNLSTGANAFNPLDVNHDGRVDLNDAFVVDKFGNKDYTDLGSQLAATINQNGTTDPTLAQQVSFNLVNAALTDGTTVIGQTDSMNKVNAGLTAAVSQSWANTNKTGPLNIVVAPTSGTISVPASTTLTISAGTFTAGGTFDVFTDNTGTATNGNHVAIANNSATANGFEISAGAKTIGTLTGTGSSKVDAGATLTTTSIVQSSLNVAGTVNIGNPGDAHSASNLSIVSSSLSITGTLNLNSQDLLLKGTAGTAAANLATVTTALSTGINGGSWNGTGITSGTAHADATVAGRTAIGAIPNTTTGSDVVRTTFDGQTGLTSNDVLVKYTYYGDANLDGSVNGTDYSRIDAGFATRNNPTPRSGWANGDFNYDGHIDGTDYALIDASYGANLPTLPSGSALPSTLVASPAALISSGPSAVPEPASLSVLAVGTITLLTRRSRRRV